MSVSMLKGVHRRALGISKDDQVMAPSGFVAGGDGKPAIVGPAPDTVAYFEDFLGDTVAGELNYFEGDTGASGTLLAGTNGIFRILLSASGAMTPAGGAGLNMGALNWKANQGYGRGAGRLRMGARVRLPKVVSHGVDTGIGSVFVGFTDTTAAEFPIYDTGAAAGPISPAADAVGFLWGARADTGWTAVSAKSTAGDSGDQQALTGVVPVQGKWTTLEVEISRGISDTGGQAVFYIDGVPRARINSPVKSDVALTPVIAICGLQANANTNLVDIDYIAVSAPRDSGS